MALPVEYVERIHQRLAIRFGSRWSSMWAGIPQADLVQDWSEQLSRLTVEGIKFALENLPTEFPPNASEFRAIANRAPVAAPLMLGAPEVDPVVAKAALSVMKTTGMPTPAEWMVQLERDVLAGTATPARKRHYDIAKANGFFGGPDATRTHLPEAQA